MLKRNKRILVVASFLLLLTPATMASANRPGATCKTVGQITTVKIKKKSTDLVCTQVGKRKLWQVRAAGIPGGTTGQPGGASGGATATTVPAGGTMTSSFVTEVSSSYAILADAPFTRIAANATPSGYLAAMGLASTSGTSLYDHPSGLASNGTNLLLVDRGNNRILVWNTAPTSSSSLPDFVLCQPSTTATASGNGLAQCNWPSDAVVTRGGKLLVADSDNHRVLVWNTFPTATGQTASYSIDLGADAWPWGVWSDGTKVAVTLTGRGQLRLWNSFPTTGSEPADITLSGDTSNCLGTPRGIVSNGTAIITGDHNGKCANSSVAHVFASWPASNSATPNYDILPDDPNYAWPHGAFDSTTGKLY